MSKGFDHVYSGWANLPSDLFVLILWPWVDGASLATLSSVCRRWKAMIDRHAVFSVLRDAHVRWYTCARDACLAFDLIAPPQPWPADLYHFALRGRNDDRIDKQMHIATKTMMVAIRKQLLIEYGFNGHYFMYCAWAYSVSPDGLEFVPPWSPSAHTELHDASMIDYRLFLPENGEGIYYVRKNGYIYLVSDQYSPPSETQIWTMRFWKRHFPEMFTFGCFAFPEMRNACLVHRHHVPTGGYCCGSEVHRGFVVWVRIRLTEAVQSQRMPRPKKPEVLKEYDRKRRKRTNKRRVDREVVCYDGTPITREQILARVWHSQQLDKNERRDLWMSVYKWKASRSDRVLADTVQITCGHVTDQFPWTTTGNELMAWYQSHPGAFIRRDISLVFEVRNDGERGVLPPEKTLADILPEFRQYAHHIYGDTVRADRVLPQ